MNIFSSMMFTVDSIDLEENKDVVDDEKNKNCEDMGEKEKEIKDVNEVENKIQIGINEEESNRNQMKHPILNNFVSDSDKVENISFPMAMNDNSEGSEEIQENKRGRDLESGPTIVGEKSAMESLSQAKKGIGPRNMDKNKFVGMGNELVKENHIENKKIHCEEKRNLEEPSDALSPSNYSSTVSPEKSAIILNNADKPIEKSHEKLYLSESEISTIVNSESSKTLSTQSGKMADATSKKNTDSSIDKECFKLLNELASDPAAFLQLTKQHLTQLRNATNQLRPVEAEPLTLLHLDILSLFNQIYQVETSIHKSHEKKKRIETEYAEIVGMVQRERSEKLALQSEVQELRERVSQLRKAKTDIQESLSNIGIKPTIPSSKRFSRRFVHGVIHGSNGDLVNIETTEGSESSNNSSNDQPIYSDAKSV